MFDEFDRIERKLAEFERKAARIEEEWIREQEREARQASHYADFTDLERDEQWTPNSRVRPTSGSILPVIAEVEKYIKMLEEKLAAVRAAGGDPNEAAALERELKAARRILQWIKAPLPW